MSSLPLAVSTAKAVGNAEAANYDSLRLSSEMSWFETLCGIVPRGSAVLLAGDPGAGKYLIALQLCTDPFRSWYYESPSVSETDPSCRGSSYFETWTWNT